MVTRADERQGLGPPDNAPGLSRQGPLVAFDFDGTLTTIDSFTAFLRWRIGAGAYYAEGLRLLPQFIRYALGRDRGRLKSAAIRVYLRGLPRAMLDQEAAEFASVMAPLILRPDALKVWRRHRADGARMVIVSASPEPIVAPFARGLGADLLIASQIAVDPQDRVSGALSGPNCRGPEKARRLREVFGEDIRLAAAYGDSDGDREMLDMADQKFMRLFVADPTKRRATPIMTTAARSTRSLTRRSDQAPTRPPRMAPRHRANP
jgi:phosphatidylglycerophosphatase C